MNYLAHINYSEHYLLIEKSVVKIHTQIVVEAMVYKNADTTSHRKS